MTTRGTISGTARVTVRGTVRLIIMRVTSRATRRGTIRDAITIRGTTRVTTWGDVFLLEWSVWAPVLLYTMYSCGSCLLLAGYSDHRDGHHSVYTTRAQREHLAYPSPCRISKSPCIRKPEPPNPSSVASLLLGSKVVGVGVYRI